MVSFISGTLLEEEPWERYTYDPPTPCLSPSKILPPP